MKKAKTARIGISLALAFSLALNAFASSSSLLETEQVLDQVPEQSQVRTASPIVEEDVSKRGEYEKHFICEDGSYIAATYPYQVHEKNETGEWVDIDNSLALENNRIENQSEVNRVSFAPKTAESSRIARLEKDGHALEWSLTGTIMKPTAQVRAAGFVGPLPAFTAEETELNSAAEAAIEPEEEAVAKPLTVEEANEEKMRLEKLTSSVLYEDAMGEGIDVRYTVIPGKVKEDIILNQPSGFRSYTMHVDANGLTAVKLDDNSVEFRNESSETIFTVSTPYMFDAADAESFAIGVEVTQSETNCTITFTPDVAWLTASERVYPITIDPTNNQNDGANYDDTYVHEGDATGYCSFCGCTHNTRDRMLAGLRNSKKHRAYFKIKDMPGLPSGNTILNANLIIYYTDNTNTGGNLTLGKCLASWSNSNLTWSNQPSYKDLETRAFYDTDSSGNRFLKFSNTTFVTELRMMYSGSETNNGFVIRAAGDETYNDYNAFYTSNSAVEKRPERPLLTVNYQAPTNIANGTYFIRNRKSGHYLTIPGNGGSLTQAVQYAFNGATNQQWKVTKNSDGYYKLEPVYNTGLALDVRGGAPTYNGQWAEVYTDNNGLAQQWAFFSNGDGSYRMMSRVDNQTRCISVNGGYTTSPTNLHMWDYTKAAEQGWYLEKADNRKFSTVNITDEGHDHTSYVNKINNAIACICGSWSNATDVKVSNIRWYYDNSSFLVIRSHGSKTSVVLADGSLTRSQMISWGTNSLKDMRLVYYAACSTGEGGATADNLVNATFNNGVKTVIGFQGAVNCSQTNTWTEEFFIATGERNKTISEACADADYWVGVYHFGIHGGTDNRLVRGSTTQRLTT